MRLLTIKFTGLLYTFLCFASCTFTTTKTKNPNISDINHLNQVVASLVTAQKMNLNGVEKTSNGKTTSEVELDITNGQNIPADNESIKSLAQNLANQVRVHLKDTNQFDVYKVLFIKQTEGSVVTKRNWIENTFTAKELTLTSE